MSYLTVLKRGQFDKLWAAQVLSQIAQNLLNFSLVIRIFDITEGTRYANISVALLILSFGIPSVLFAAVAGAYVDNWDRKKVLIITNLLRMILVLGYLIVGSNLLMLLLLTFVISTITQFFAPAESASIPKLVQPGELINANAIFIFSFYACFVIGYAAAAPMIALFGPQSPYIFTAAMFAAATVLTFILPKLGEGHREHGTLIELMRRTQAELVESRRRIVANVNLWLPMLQMMIIQGMVSVLLALAPALSLAVLKRPIQDASHFLVIPTAVGMIGGVVLVGWLESKFSKLRLVRTGLILAGVALTGLGLTGLLWRQINGRALANMNEIGWIVAVLVLTLGLMNSVVSVSAQTLLHEHSTDEMRGKIFGALNTVINLASTLPVLLAGIFADLFSPTEVISVVGLIVLAAAVGQAWYLRKHLNVERELSAQ